MQIEIRSIIPTHRSQALRSTVEKCGGGWVSDAVRPERLKEILHAQTLQTIVLITAENDVAAICALLNSVVDSDRKSTRLNSSHVRRSYAVFCLKKKTLRDDVIGDVIILELHVLVLHHKISQDGAAEVPGSYRMPQRPDDIERLGSQGRFVDDIV